MLLHAVKVWPPLGSVKSFKTRVLELQNCWKSVHLDKWFCPTFHTQKRKQGFGLGRGWSQSHSKQVLLTPGPTRAIPLTLSTQLDPQEVLWNIEEWVARTIVQSSLPCLLYVRHCDLGKQNKFCHTHTHLGWSPRSIINFLAAWPYFSEPQFLLL